MKCFCLVWKTCNQWKTVKHERFYDNVTENKKTYIDYESIHIYVLDNIFTGKNKNIKWYNEYYICWNSEQQCKCIIQRIEIKVENNF